MMAVIKPRADAGAEQQAILLAEFLDYGGLQIEGAHQGRGHQGLLQGRHDAAFLFLFGHARLGGAARKNPRPQHANGAEQDAERGQTPLEREHQGSGEQQIHEGLEAPRNPGGESVLEGGDVVGKTRHGVAHLVAGEKVHGEILEMLEHALPQREDDAADDLCVEVIPRHRGDGDDHGAGDQSAQDEHRHVFAVPQQRTVDHELHAHRNLRVEAHLQSGCEHHRDQLDPVCA
jgi:hypothetical protein